MKDAKLKRKAIYRILKESRQKVMVCFAVVILGVSMAIGGIYAYYSSKIGESEKEKYEVLSKDIYKRIQDISVPREVQSIEILPNMDIKIIFHDKTSTTYLSTSPSELLYNNDNIIFSDVFCAGTIAIIVIFIIIGLEKVISVLRNKYEETYNKILEEMSLSNGTDELRSNPGNLTDADCVKETEKETESN